MERVQEFAMGLDACKVSLTGWAGKKPMTLSWRWNVSDTIWEEKWLGTSRHWKVDHVTFWAPTKTILSAGRAKESESEWDPFGNFDRFGKQLNSTCFLSHPKAKTWEKDFPPIWGPHERPNWGPKWSHDNLILGFSLADSPLQWLKLSKDLK